MNGPHPTSYEITENGGHATFDPVEMKAYLETTSDKSWFIRDGEGNIIKIMNVERSREAWLD